MKAAIVTAAGLNPVYREFATPTAGAGQELITVRAAALSHLAKARAAGAHYSSDGVYPAIAGVDGVGTTQDGRRVYFAIPDAPFGALAEFCPIAANRCVPLPDALDDITAAAIANPGMSAWAALVERAHLVRGETVLINGATGTAGRIAVQLAKYLGAGKVIATGRNPEELAKLGVDLVIPFTKDMAQYEDALQQAFASGINIVIDYLWGQTAQAILSAIVKSVVDATPVRFVHVGAASGEDNIVLPGAALRSSAILLMGSGLKSVPMPVLLQSIRSVFEAVQPAGLAITTNVVPLSQVEQVWAKDTGKPRVVFTMG
jgi:NADPH:quinone reductase-like Zn-dependent oxidoreductase